MITTITVGTTQKKETETIRTEIVERGYVIYNNSVECSSNWNIKRGGEALVSTRCDTKHILNSQLASFE